MPSSASLPLPLPKQPFGNIGRWILDADGRVVIIRGVNMINKLPPYTLSATGFSEDDADLLASNGFNAVRVGVIYSALEPAPGLYDAQYLQDIQQTVHMLGNRGILSLIDFHQDGWGPMFVTEGFPEWATLTSPYKIRPLPPFPEMYMKSRAVQTAFDNFWNNAAGPDGVGLQDRYAKAWAYVAKHLKGERSILGWELINEPFPGTDWRKYRTGKPWPPLDKALTRFTQRVVNAIRRQDPDHFIWYEPWVTFDAGIPTYIGAINDPGPVRRIGMAFHNYMKAQNFETNWNNAIAHSQATGDALLATEFGACKTASLIQRLMTSVEKARMPAIYWAYWNRTPYPIAGNGKTVSSAGMGIVYDPTLPLEGDNVSTEKLTALTRPYPMFIAGSLNEETSGWQFSPGTLHFKLQYTRVPGKPKGVTEIFVPTLRYPNGFSVSIAGGKQIASNNPQVVLISNNAEAATVKVKITPKT